MYRTKLFETRSCAALLAAAALSAAAQAQALRFYYEGPNTGDRLGYVAALADLDGDGANEYAIGAPGMANTDGYVGVASVYSGLTGSLLFEKRGDQYASDFGHALAAAGDYDGDGVDDFIVGDRADSFYGTLAGKATVYSGLTGGWLLSTYGTKNDQHGTAVCGVGDITGDGRSEVAFGIPGANKVTVWSRTGSSTVMVWKWVGSSTGSFGTSVRAAGDVDADGVPDIIVGEPGYDPSSSKFDVGRAHVYSGATGNELWSYTGTNSYDYLAWSVDGIGDVDGDGHDDVIVGCDQDDTYGSSSGRAVVLSGIDGSELYEMFGYGAHENFGTRVCGVGDLNGDGTNDLAISASRFNNDIGRITTHSGIDGAQFHDTYDHTQGEQWSNIDAGDFDGDGDPDLIIGTPSWVDPIVDNGRIEVYRTSKATWTNYGAGWPGTVGGIPAILGVSGPWVGRTTDVFIENSTGVSGSFALLLIGLADLSVPTNKDGTLLVAPLMVVPFTFLSTSGITLFGLIPDDVDFVDEEFFLQAITADPGASKGLSFTGGLKGHIGFEYP